MSATKVAVIGLLATLLVAGTAADAVAVDKTTASNASQKAIQEVCAKAKNQTICIHTLSQATNSTDTKTIIQVYFQVNIKKIKKVIKYMDEAIKKNSTDDGLRGKYQCCQNWLPKSVDNLQRAIDAVNSVDTTANFTALTDDIRNYVEDSYRYQTSCEDCIEDCMVMCWQEDLDRAKIITDVMHNVSYNVRCVGTEFPNLVKSSSKS